MSSSILQSISCAEDAVVMIVTDEVEAVMRAKIQQILKFFYVELCYREILKLLDCSESRVKDEDIWTIYFQDAKKMISSDMIQELGVNLSKLVDVPLSGWRDYANKLQRMSSNVAQMTSDDMYFPPRNEIPLINFVKELCDVREHSRELSLEIFHEFVYALNN